MVIVRFWKGLVWRKAWCAFKRVVGMAVFGATGGNPFGSRPNFFGRQHLTFDKGRAWTPEVERPEFRKECETNRAFIKGHGRPKLNAQSFARMRNQQSVHKGAWMPEVERPKFCRTQNKQSVHMASVLAIFEG